MFDGTHFMWGMHWFWWIFLDSRDCRRRVDDQQHPARSFDFVAFPADA